MIVSGWYESEYGVQIVEMDIDATDNGEVAYNLWLQYGDECAGVDIELDGTFPNGKDIDTIRVMNSLEWLVFGKTEV